MIFDIVFFVFNAVLVQGAVDVACQQNALSNYQAVRRKTVI